MTTRLAIAVVQGGPSAEAEVSRASARAIGDALKEAGHHAVRMELNAFLPESLRSGGFDVVFPAVHGAVGEDGALQGLFEVLDLPYVGSGVLASALAMDKRQARIAFAAAGLPIARGLTATRGRDASAETAERALREVSARLVVKPAESGSAIGVVRFDEGALAADVARAIEEAWALSSVAVVEHFAKGREVTCGVLEDAALPPTEIHAPNDAFYTYQARYAPGRSRHDCPARLGEALTRRVQDVALAAHRALGCRDLSRADFIIGDTDGRAGAGEAGDPDAVTLLEVNTLPGFTATSLFPEAAGVAGVPLPVLVDRLVRAAHARGPTKRNAALPLPR
jgi:D-alanine-D-alanine ligase